jgi:hypothetical protein
LPVPLAQLGLGYRTGCYPWFQPMGPSGSKASYAPRLHGEAGQEGNRGRGPRLLRFLGLSTNLP